MSGASPVVFNYDFWIRVYPEFIGVTPEQAQEAFNLATLYLDNTQCSMVPVLNAAGQPVRIRILGMITAQIAQLLYGSTLQPISPLVGRIASAAEGTVNVATEFAAPVGAAWFLQTKYGAMAWQALAPYRTAIYIAAPQYPYGRFGPGFGGFPWPR